MVCPGEPCWSHMRLRPGGGLEKGIVRTVRVTTATKHSAFTVTGLVGKTQSGSLASRACAVFTCYAVMFLECYC